MNATLVWSVQVVANQVVLGPIVITLVFAWNKLWEGHLEQLPNLYRTRALPTLIDGECKHSQFKNMFLTLKVPFGVGGLLLKVQFTTLLSLA